MNEWILVKDRGREENVAACVTNPTPWGFLPVTHWHCIGVTLFWSSMTDYCPPPHTHTHSFFHKREPSWCLHTMMLSHCLSAEALMLRWTGSPWAEQEERPIVATEICICNFWHQQRQTYDIHTTIFSEFQEKIVSDTCFPIWMLKIVTLELLSVMGQGTLPVS